VGGKNSTARGKKAVSATKGARSNTSQSHWKGKKRSHSESKEKTAKKK